LNLQEVKHVIFSPPHCCDAGAAAMFGFYVTLSILPLAECISLLYVNPVFCALLGWVVLREGFGWRTSMG
jgi:drug/metabolite transporter (DMT)-like permease